MNGVPSSGTKSLENMIASFGEIFDALGTYVMFARQIDDMRLTAAKALASGQPANSTYAQRLKEMESKKVGAAQKELQRHSGFNNRMAYQLAYNAFQTYLSSLIKQIYNVKKEMLNSKDKVSFKEIISFSRMNDLIEYLIDKRINDLTFKSISELNSDFYDRYGFKFFDSPLRISTISKIAQRRNLLVHSNGIVNHGYIERTSDKRAKLGKSVPLHNASTLITYLLRVAVEIDLRARSKFGLKAVRFKIEGSGNV
jgi:hypothetical protein